MCHANIIVFLFGQGSQLEEIQQNQDRLEEQLACQQTDREAYQQMLEEVVSLKQNAETQGKKVVALEKACAVSAL